jgi:hypothetical protein
MSEKDPVPKGWERRNLYAATILPARERFNELVLRSQRWPLLYVDTP